MNLDIEIEHEGWQAIAGLEELARRAAAAVLVDDARAVTLLFSDDSEIRVLNREWRGQDKPTNVLSFPSAADMALPAGEAPPLGDIILAYETVAREAAEQNKTFADHTAHLIVHGILHLLGYDHMEDTEAEEMEARERTILATLGITDPYAT
ncbi:MAG: rRNA maturation RNase YbeY [Proteobacteria bacterium]|nr:rRNA maturation RNase YbeY [Pseudomonadota bacterium]